MGMMSQEFLLETPQELATRVGLPVSNIRYLIASGQIEVIYTTPGKRNPKIPSGAWERYINFSTGRK